MKLKLLFILFSLAICNKAFSQCPGCLIDSTITSVGIYPDTLPDGTVSLPYDEDITFVMFLDTLGFAVNTFQIVSVSGLPSGISWECNNAGTGCVYDPSVSIYGCVKICGTPYQAGVFNMVVTVIADIQLVGNQTVTFVRPFTIVQGSVSNSGFSASPASGCSPVTIQFNSIIPALSYAWDFGNLTTDTAANPVVTYSTPGDYVVTQNATVAYTLDSITVNSIPDNWHDIILGLDLDPDPDMYFTLSDAGGNQIYDSSPTIDNTYPPLTWTGLNIAVTNQTYSLHMQDGELIGAADDLGTVTFNPTAVTGTVTATVSGATGILSITWYSTPTIITNTDTIHVFASPASPAISSTGNDSICAGDSVLLSIASNPGSVFQWYNDTVMLLGYNDSTLWVNLSGNYWITVQDANGCSASSAVYAFTVVPNPPKPTYSAIGNTLTCYLTGYNLQWYVNGTLIPGATNAVHDATVAGLYNVVASNYFGCATTSDTVLLTGVGLNELSAFDNFQINPSQGDGDITMQVFSNSTSDATLIISDMSGRIITQKNLKLTTGQNTFNENISSYENGIYLIQLNDKLNKVIQKYVKMGL